MNNIGIQNTLKKINKNDLLEFIIDYAEKDAKFMNALNVKFSAPENKNELIKLGNQIDSLLKYAASRRGRDSWGYMNIDISGVLDELYERSRQGHIKLAFDGAEMLYRKMLEVFEYQEECELSDEIENLLSTMSDMADESSEQEDKDYIFEQCISLSEIETAKEYGADYEVSLFKIAAKFITRDNLPMLEEAMDSCNYYYAPQMALIRLEIERKLGGDDAARIFIEENLKYHEIREIAYENAHAKNDLPEEERLCMLDSPVPINHPGISPWLYRLYTVREKMGDLVKMTETAKAILVEGDLKFFDTLKTLLEKQSAWESELPELLQTCKNGMAYTNYMAVLARVDEHALLLEQVEAHRHMVYEYGKLLGKHYPERIKGLFIEQIETEAQKAANRQQYSAVCSKIMIFFNAGFKADAMELVCIFKNLYKHKPAFIDELNRFKNLNECDLGIVPKAAQCPYIRQF